jgi:hypothetical protein
MRRRAAADSACRIEDALAVSATRSPCSERAPRRSDTPRIATTAWVVAEIPRQGVEDHRHPGRNRRRVANPRSAFRIRAARFRNAPRVHGDMAGFLDKERTVAPPGCDRWLVLLGLSAAFGGRWLERAGPRKSGLLAAVCWGAGFLVAAARVRLHAIVLVYLGYGVEHLRCRAAPPSRSSPRSSPSLLATRRVSPNEA